MTSKKVKGIKYPEFFFSFFEPSPNPPDPSEVYKYHLSEVWATQGKALAAVHSSRFRGTRYISVMVL